MSVPVVTAAIAIFVIAALLYYQSPHGESFVNPPTAGRPYNPLNADTDYDNVPADLNKAPMPGYTTQIPQALQRPTMVPGAGVAPSDAPASIKELRELDNEIDIWVQSANMYERDNPGSLSFEQIDKRAELLNHQTDIKTQVASGKVIMTHKAAAQEIMSLRVENKKWQRFVPDLSEINGFARHEQPMAFLTSEQYTQFKQLLGAILQMYKRHVQPEPLKRARIPQLETVQSDLQYAEKEFKGTPPIRVESARLFLHNALQPEQPLPTLVAIGPHSGPSPVSDPDTKNDTRNDPSDIIWQLRNLEWKLTVKYDPGEQELKRSIAALLKRLSTERLPEQDLAEIRREISNIQNKHSPSGYDLTSSGSSNPGGYNPSLTPFRPTPTPAPGQEHDPTLQARAETLCKQIHEAFPHDAEALGCPKQLRQMTRYEAESAINLVCDRLRTSVPTVTPEQFNCPRRAV